MLTRNLEGLNPICPSGASHTLFGAILMSLSAYLDISEACAKAVEPLHMLVRSLEGLQSVQFGVCKIGLAHILTV